MGTIIPIELVMLFQSTKLNIDTEQIAAKVFSLRHLWILRSDDFEFYTLGRCAYLDGETPEYSEDIQITNPILLQVFFNMYDEVIRHLETHLNEEIVLNHKLAYPSFHIFGSSPLLLTHSGSWHQDSPHTTLNLGEEDPLTFTLAIKLPTGGAGLEYTLDNETVIYYPYTEGSIVVHDGAIVHRIASIREYVPNEYRITLQGHLIRIDGKLNLFW